MNLKTVGAAVAFAALLSVRSVASETTGVLYNFTGGSDGGDPATGLIFDRAGDLFGTTVVGGTYGYGTVFELIPMHGGAQESVLHSFSASPDGKNPYGGVTFDDAGNLYGTTVAGGSGGACVSDGCGTVYELTPKGEIVLYSFTGGNDGFGPGGGVSFDKSGNLYGTTPDGGAYSAGTVYELVHKGKNWQEHVIYSFTGGLDGSTGSLGSPLIDSHGNLYGVTELAGANNAGTAFELSPQSHGKWKLTTLYAFKGMPDAGSPYGGLIADKRGNLYGTTYYGGANGVGAVFELIQIRSGWTEKVLYSFTGGTDGGSPTSTPLLDKAGNLYATTTAGGDPSCNCGTAFKLTAHTWKESVIHAFGTAQDGAYPSYGLVPDKTGHLYTSAVEGGLYGQGTIEVINR